MPAGNLLSRHCDRTCVSACACRERIPFRSPGSAGTGLGIGVNTAIFSIVQSVLIQSDCSLCGQKQRAKELARPVPRCQSLRTTKTRVAPSIIWQICFRTFTTPGPGTGNLSSIRVPLLCDVPGPGHSFLSFPDFLWARHAGNLETRMGIFFHRQRSYMEMI